MEDPTAYFKTDLLVPDIEPIHVILNDGETHAQVYPITCADQVPKGLAQYICDEFNLEIERGNTYPHDEPLTVEEFILYWFSQFAAIMTIGDSPSLNATTTNWEQSFLGTFYIKPNYPGRCSHVCNAGFLVNSAIRGKGIGKIMGQLYLQLAPKLGYTYSVFNLVFETNVASIKIWDALGFERVGRIKGAGRLKGHENKVDAIVFGKDLV